MDVQMTKSAMQTKKLLAEIEGWFRFDPDLTISLIDEVAGIIPNAEFGVNTETEPDGRGFDILWIFTGIPMMDVLRENPDAVANFRMLEALIQRMDFGGKEYVYGDEVDYNTYECWLTESTFGYKHPIPGGMGDTDQIVWRLFWD